MNKVLQKIIKTIGLGLLLCASLAMATAGAVSLNKNFPVTDGFVHAIAHDDTNIYIGGYFNLVGQSSGSGVALNGTTGQPLNASWPPVVGIVYTAIPDGAGGWYIGGDFSKVGGVTRNSVAHIRANNTVGDFDPDITSGPDNPGRVRSLALSGTTLYVGGYFITVNSSSTMVERSNLAAFDTTQAINNVTAFSPSVDRDVRALLLSGNTLYAGGIFTSVNHNATVKTRNYLAAFDTTQATNNATDFDPDVDGGVLALNLSGSILYAGGYFTSVNNNATAKTRNNLAAFDTTINTDNATGFDPSPNMDVRALTRSGTTLYAGGNFYQVNTNATPKNRNHIAAFDTTVDINNATAFDPAVTDYVYSLALDGTTLYAGGDFGQVNFNANIKTRRRLAAFDVTQATDNATNFDPAMGGEVHAVAAVAGNVYAGGDFDLVGGTTRNYLAAFDLSSSSLLPFDPSLSGMVNVLLLSGDILYAGGSFGNVNTNGASKIRYNLAAFDTTLATDNATAFAPDISGSQVRGMALDGATLYAGGQFSQVNVRDMAQDRNNIAAFDTTIATNNVTDFDPDLNDWVSDILLSGTTLYASGGFTEVNSNATPKTRNYLAAFDTTLATDNATDFDPGVNNLVYSLASSGTTLYAGGNFTEVNSNATPKTRNRLAAFDTTLATDNATDFDPSVSSLVYRLHLSGNTLYAGGGFSAVNTNTTIKRRNNLAAFDITLATDNATDFVVDANGYVGALANRGDTLYVGGSFNAILGETRGRFAVLNLQPMDADIDISPASINYGTIVVGESSSAHVLTIVNNGGVNLSVMDITLTGNDAAEFSLDTNGGSSPCGGTSVTLQPSNSCTITAIFSPQSDSAKNASITIDSNDPDTPTVMIPLTGTGVTSGGGGGGGCTISSNSPFDPLIPLMVTIALLYLASSRWLIIQRNRQEV